MFIHVYHCISCLFLNFELFLIGNISDIDRLQEFGKRVDEWQTICKKRGLSENVTFRIFGGIEKDRQRVEEYVWKLKSEVELS